MFRRNKEEDKVEKIIRGLLKLPENKRCINCNSLGPQYVCTTFWTFVCTNCSGIHREFTHRVKSVSMSKFSAEEVSALQAGGNERAREIYFKAWDAHRNLPPDGSNLHRLRDFIKHVYVDRKYTGERSNDKLAMVRVGADDDRYDRHRSERSSRSARDDILELQLSERSKRFAKDRVLDRHSSEISCRGARDEIGALTSERSSQGARNDFLDHHSFDRGAKEDFFNRNSLERPNWGARDDYLDRHPSERANHGGRDDFFERHSFDKASIGKRRDDRSFGSYIEEGRSPRYRQENVRSGGRKKSTTHFEIVDDRFREDSFETARRCDSLRYLNNRSRAESSSPDSEKRKDMTKLPGVRAVKDIFGDRVPPLKVGESTKSIDLKGADGSQHHQKTAGSTDADSVNGRAKENNLVSINSLLDFDAIPEAPATTETQEGQQTALSNDVSNSTASSTIEHAPNVNPLENMLLDWSAPEVASSEAPAGGASNVSGSLKNDPAMSSNAGAPVPAENRSSTAQQSHDASARDDSQSSGRRELPADLFASHAPFSAPAPGWQLCPPHGMGYGMPYNPVTMSMVPFSSPSNSRNPFDIGDATPQVAAQTFPSMSSLQGALPNMTASGFQMQAPLYAASFQPQQTPYGMAMAPGAYGAQEVYNNTMDSRPQNSHSQRHADAFASMSPVHHPVETTSYTSPSAGGNPFG